MHDEFECGCCSRCYAQGQLCGWIGVGTPVAICFTCYRHYMAARLNFPDKQMDELLETVKLICALESLPPVQKQQMRRLIFLVHNHSQRANRLVELAVNDQISVAQLLSII